MIVGMINKYNRKDKPSFFKRLLGNYDDYDYEDDNEDSFDIHENNVEEKDESSIVKDTTENEIETEEDTATQPEIELSIDLKDSGDFICINAAIPGVTKEDIDISLQREMIVITTHSKSEMTDEGLDGEYFYRELEIGQSSRTVVLPDEVDVEKSVAKIKHGMLFIKLPKLDKKKEIQLEVESE